ncbi:type VI secretion system contractile sheath large subunit [Shewanella surugensis]|uniref:Type VI secretion system contractile sheath large subunit n=1 Tax=Shewanella surugensis TaxID=212020 RepID=A0ABT0L6Y7_9GAMM|nr:type VI secretion system contractile sheath large subunit [Shewanella surugensis]MCL1123466.1 type VI secretion system contractile sheath large subunit [Shewanella surugensis]
MAEQKDVEQTSGATEGNLLDEIVQATRLSPDDQAYSVTRTGLQELLKGLVQPEKKGAKISGELLDVMIGELDQQLSAQVNEILHDDQFKQLESAWRGLKFLIDRTDFRENVKIEYVNISKQDLMDDFEDSPEIVQSGLYRTAYTAEYGQFGGQPYGTIVGNYDFSPSSPDMALLKNLSAVSAMSHAPFIAAAGPEFFGIQAWEELPRLKDLQAIFEGPQYTKWRSFRESDDSRYVALTLPRFLLRLPYSQEENPSKLFNYNESVSNGDKDFCWGNTAFAFANRITDSFAQYRWCANIVGPQGGGAVEDLPVHQFESMGEVKSKVPTQVLVSERREYELAEEGFICLTMRKGSDNAAFFSANSCQKPKSFGNSPEGKEAETNYKLSTQLPYMMVMDRLAHYIKVLQRENIGLWKERQDLDRELNKWIGQYVTEMDNPDASVRSRRPLRAAKITVSDVPGDPGWYQVSISARPHFKYMGASFTLSLVGKLDKD